MRKPILKFNSDISKLYENTISLLTVEAEELKQKSKSLYQYKNQFYSVEEFSALFFKENGYLIYYGVDFSQVFSYISFNFDYDTSVFENYILGSRLIDSKALHQKFRQLELLRNITLENNELNNELISLAQELMELYYFTYEPKKLKLIPIFDFVRSLPQEEIIRLIRFYHRISGLKRGTPDLFIFKDKKYWFVEVKSSNDSLSKYQNFFIHHFQEIVGENIFVLNVVDKIWS
jgi:hypothetical protein